MPQRALKTALDPERSATSGVRASNARKYLHHFHIADPGETVSRVQSGYR
jgi:hypothetical protein